jgi:hypothetical protein
MTKVLGLFALRRMRRRVNGYVELDLDQTDSVSGNVYVFAFVRGLEKLERYEEDENVP